MKTLDLLDLIEQPTNILSEESHETFGARLFKSLKKETRVYPRKKDSWTRGSGMGHLCPREEVLAYRKQKIRIRESSGAGLMIMSIGTRFHSWMQEHAAHMLVGSWRCKRKIAARSEGSYRVCGYRTDMDGHPRVPLPTFACPRCGARKWKFYEKMYSDEFYKVRGHPDGFSRLSDDPDDDEVLELKTQFEYGWKSSKEPYKAYMEQVQTYMWLTGLKRARIIMANKNGTGESPTGWFKEFVYGRDEQMIDMLKKKALEVKDGLRNNALPERICISKTCKRATDCDLVGHCFATEEGVVHGHAAY